MSVAYDITLTVDDTAVNRSLAQINQNIAQIGARTSGAPGVTALNNQLQQVIAQNPAVGRVITSMGQIGRASGGSANQVQALHAQLQSLIANNPQIQAIVTQIQQVGGAAAGAASQSSGLFGGLGASARAAMSQLGGLGGSMASIATAGAALGVTAAVGGLVAVGAAAVNASAKFEAYRASLTTVLGDSDKAGQAFDRLVQFAAKTPFSLDQSVEGFIKLKALGLQPSERAMISYGNTASAMGKDLNQMVEAVADAATGEYERLKEFGIKASKQGNETAFTFQGVTTKVKNNSTDIQAYLMRIGETDFAGAMAKQMETFNGATSNLSDTVQQTLAKIGDGLNKPLAAVINMISSGLSAIAPVLGAIGSMFGGLISGITSIVSGVASVFAGIAGGGSRSVSIIEGLTVAFNLVGQTLSTFGALVGSVFGFFGQLIGSVTEMWRSSFGGVLEWMGASFESGGRSWGNAVIGVLRAVKTVVGLMPQLFSVAINDVMKMFRSLGSVVGRLLSGDLSALKDVGGAITGSFGNTAKALNAVGRIGNATYRDERGATAAWDRLRGAGRTGGASLSDLAGRAPVAAPPAGAGKDGKSKADEAAKQAADRLKAEREYWQALEQSAAVAAMLPQAAEAYNEELKLRKILGNGELKDASQLNEAQRKRLTDALALKSLNEVLKSTKEGIQSADIEAARNQARIAATTGQTAEKAAENLAVEEKLWPIKQAAMQRGISLADAELQKQLAILGAKERQNFLTERGNQLAQQRRDDGIAYATSALSTDGTKEDRRKLATDARDKALATLEAAKSSMSPEAFRAGVNRAAREFRETINDAAGTWASRFGGVLNELGSRIGGKLGSAVSRGGDVASAIGNFRADSEATSKTISGLFSNPKSGLATGIGNAVGGAMAGLQIGESIAGLGKALGLKMSTTGSKIGGAVGGAFFGPIGSIVGSVAGGLLGGLFKKAKTGSAAVTGVEAAGLALSGNNAKARDAATGLGGSVQSGLSQIASELGATIGSFRVVIGTYKDQIRVQTNNTPLGGKGSVGAITFKTEAEAVSYAIKSAISQGALQGLSAMAQKFVAAFDIDSAISAAKDYNAAMADYAAMIDPAKAAVEAVTKGIDALRETMVRAGATAADLANIDDYRNRKLALAYKEATKTFDDLLETLSGEGSGTTALSRFNADMDKFAAFKTDIAAGKAVDKDAFSALANKIMTGADKLYGGSTSQMASVMSMLTETTLAAKSLVTAQFPASVTQDATVNAINSGNAELVSTMQNTTAAIAINNGYQEQILEAIQNLGSSGGGYSTKLNGREAQV